MKKIPCQNLYLLIFSLFVSFLICEMAVRLIGKYDRDGNFYFFSRRLKPYKFSIVATDREINKYLSHPDSSIMYDEDLGWTFRPNTEAGNRFYFYNSDGIRTIARDYKISMNPRKDTIRIAIFGDSFTHGDDVPFTQTWGYYLENYLKALGVKAEVLDFGVCAYGMDQAFLRWKKIGYKFSPDIVILGFVPENIARNVNLIRSIYFSATGIPFSKPRFILDRGKLKLINVPSCNPQRMVTLMENIGSWELLKYEYWLKTDDYKIRPWLRSRFAALLLDFIERRRNCFATDGRDSLYSVHGEPCQLTLKIIEAFDSDVKFKKAKFYIVYLPRQEELRLFLNKAEPPYAELLKLLDKNYAFIHPEKNKFFATKNLTMAGLFVNAHYSGKMNDIVAKEVAGFIFEHGVGKNKGE